MKTGPTSDQENMPSSGYPRYKPIYINIFSSNPPVHVMETGPTQQGLGCIPKKLESHLCLCFVAFALIRKVLRKVQQDQTFMILITPAWHFASMVENF